MILGCVTGLAVNCMLYRPVLGYIVHGYNDFVCYYAAAQLSGTRALYDEAAITQAQIALGDHRHAVVFTRLPFYADWLSPLRFFNFDVAYWIWQALSLIRVLLFIYFWPARDRWMTALACCWSLPLLEAFISGPGRDDCFWRRSRSPWRCCGRGRPFAAGCVFSLCCLKYHLFLTLPLLILARRMWKFAGAWRRAGRCSWRGRLPSRDGPGRAATSRS